MNVWLSSIDSGSGLGSNWRAFHHWLRQNKVLILLFLNYSRFDNIKARNTQIAGGPSLLTFSSGVTINEGHIKSLGRIKRWIVKFKRPALEIVSNRSGTLCIGPVLKPVWNLPFFCWKLFIFEGIQSNLPRSRYKPSSPDKLKNSFCMN